VRKSKKRITLGISAFRWGHRAEIDLKEINRGKCEVY
jgi:hypothetical protein